MDEGEKEERGERMEWRDGLRSRRRIRVRLKGQRKFGEFRGGMEGRMERMAGEVGREIDVLKRKGERWMAVEQRRIHQSLLLQREFILREKQGLALS